MSEYADDDNKGERFADFSTAGEIGVSAQTISDDQQPLNGNELKPLDDRYYYQPNPFDSGSKAFRR